MAMDDINIHQQRPTLDLSGRVSYQGASTYDVPAAPRIYVPYSAIDRSELPDSARSWAPTSSRSAFDPNNAPPWAYEDRRTAQEIVSRIFLGPTAAAKSKAFLQTHGINLTMGIQYAPPGAQLPKIFIHSAASAARELGINCHATLTHGDHDLMCKVKEMAAAIAAHLKSDPRNKVLVFDETGNERAAVVVAAYLLETYPEIGFIKAMQAVHSCRRCVAYTDAHKSLMQTYDDLLQARHDVVSATGPKRNSEAVSAAADASSVPTAQPTKRARSEERSDMAMDMEAGSMSALMDYEMPAQDDIERFADRHFAPFVDAP